MTDTERSGADRVVEIRKLWTVFKTPDGDQVVHRDLDLTIVIEVTTEDVVPWPRLSVLGLTFRPK